MAQDSKIEWTHHTANLWWGCTKVHAGCDNCYAETWSVRWKNDLWGNNKPRKEIASVWKELERFQKIAAAAGQVHRVFVGSMMDIFEKSFPMISKNGESGWITTEQARNRLFSWIDAGMYPNLQFLLLTKRPSNINKMIPASWLQNPPENVIFGASVSDQETYETIISHLLKVNGKRFLSIEPQIGKIVMGDRIWKECQTCDGEGSLAMYENDEHVGGRPCPHCLEPYQGKISGIHWVIVGGESGHGKRPFNPDWARALRAECHTAKIPFFMKQWDKVKPIPEDLLIRQFP